MNPPPPARDKILFTPGPLTTSATVKQAMLRDLGSRDGAFIELVAAIRRRLVGLAGVAPGDYTAVLMQGSGTFGIEATIGSTVPPDGKLLVVINGAYGRRMATIAKALRIPCIEVNAPEHALPQPTVIAALLKADPGITNVAVVHCETTTGIFNPVEAIGAVVAEHGRTFIVDAMSSFGAVPLDMGAAHVDYLISSANKCIEGVPGFSFVIARKAALLDTAGSARSLSLDLLSQYQGLEDNGQFRFTPPTHALLAFAQALDELDAEGGVAGRAARYRHNHTILHAGMSALGFEAYLTPEVTGYIITSYRYPADPNFDFGQLYERLNQRGYVIYPGKVSNADCFRIGHIGRIFEADVRGLLAAMKEVLGEMGVALPLKT
jgi:2-aminoethylphosphonate-pyruvate transaminase